MVPLKHSKKIEDQEIQSLKNIIVINSKDEYAAYQAYSKLPWIAKQLHEIIINWEYEECFPSQFLLATLCDCSRKHVNYCLKHLHRIGLINKWYRHRQTCKYTIHKWLRKLDFKNYKMHLRKFNPFSRDGPPKVTPEVTPSNLRGYSKEYSSCSGVSKRGDQRKRMPKGLWKKNWLPPITEIESKCRPLAVRLRHDPQKYWNMLAFTQQAFHTVFDRVCRMYRAGEKVGDPLAYLMSGMLAMVPKHKRNWSIAGLFKKYQGLYEG